MNLYTFKKLLAIQTTKFFAWTDSSPEDRPFARMQTDCKVRGLDDGVAVSLTYLESGYAIIEFIFDRLEPTLDNLLLINNFNSNVTDIRASIQKRGNNSFLVLDVTSGTQISEQDAVNFFLSTMNDINNDSTIRYLEPLTVITK